MTDLVDAMCASRIKILEETLKDCKDRLNECDETKQALLKQIDDVYEMLDTIDLTPEQRARLKHMVTITTYRRNKQIRLFKFPEGTSSRIPRPGLRGKRIRRRCY